ncbi:hypothetical protein [Planosporangium mesophilum]|uniref:Uncharacterized protein n=1 Tax=Planosporangium mesophilum TaxID=689768 RepID=A0A8J3TGE3_9ACTN|nr:hypothetical protein [Planosporangium mesophilum]NJC86254.1 hypothetical protein [Planosporangium mesophilum]GII25779.1 hypothetical protein Pme01_53760 [Planosporangium mesophilum]
MQTDKGSTEPVFVDTAGRRRRFVMITGAAGGVVLVLTLLALLAGFTGAGPRHLPWLPGSGAGQAQEAAATPHPSGTAGFGRRARQGTSPAAGVRLPSMVPSPAVAPAADITTASPAPPESTNTHRRVPTQTPAAHPSKKK